jgi:hypothetical protein
VCIVQVTRLSNDPASGAAKPTSTAPAKGIAPPASVFDPTVPHPWAAEMLQQVAKERDQVSPRQQPAISGEATVLASIPDFQWLLHTRLVIQLDLLAGC